MSPQSLVRRVRAQPDQVRVIRREVRDFALEHGATDPNAVALAVSEAVTNAIVHAYVDAPEPGEIEVVAQRAGDDASDPARGLPPRPDSPGVGLGLPLVATLAESFEVQARAGGGTQVRMAFAAAQDDR
jgi:anti-sigma regulatory factor (Ser/Thr protein kinase)